MCAPRTALCIFINSALAGSTRQRRYWTGSDLDDGDGDKDKDSDTAVMQMTWHARVREWTMLGPAEEAGRCAVVIRWTHAQCRQRGDVVDSLYWQEEGCFLPRSQEVNVCGRTGVVGSPRVRSGVTQGRDR